MPHKVDQNPSYSDPGRAVTFGNSLFTLPAQVKDLGALEEINKAVDAKITKAALSEKLRQRMHNCLNAAAAFAVLGAWGYPLIQCFVTVPFFQLQVVCCIVISIACFITALVTFYQKQQKDALPLASYESFPPEKLQKQHPQKEEIAKSGRAIQIIKFADASKAWKQKAALASPVINNDNPQPQFIARTLA